MDFRELGSFKHALLCKQGWRLLEFPNSLAACMLKPRYFLDTDFLQASHGDYPSFTWRWLSILWGRELLQLGLHLHIGDGPLVRIYGDSWIPHARVFMAQSWAILDPDARVSELLTASGGWDIPKIYQVFNFQLGAVAMRAPGMVYIHATGFVAIRAVATR
ncbi:PREDICTED: reverse mRNAase [Prunus dulcis]|uniref:PREDICTED: reverse mRNAase n=1 Tax=Prunus dulcis TaxID=3755 RepID=A0A5E4GD42_PRUDU|nr:PREDICTED: reverse mRNAase [Prunus dulcis]